MTSEIVWRRQWKPDLLAQPWKPVALNQQCYYIKTNITHSSYEFLITDSISFWYEELFNDGIIKRTKRLNPSVEAPSSKILDHIRDSLEICLDNAAKKKDIKLTIGFKNIDDSDDQILVLTLSTKLAGLPFVWKFTAEPAEDKVVSEHLTLPLLSMVGEMFRRQEELYKILRSKDKEIDDLKAQGAKVSRKHLETGEFDETVFKHTMSVSKGFSQVVDQEGISAFSSVGQDLYRDIMTKHAYLRRPDKDDQDYEEGETFSGESTSADLAPGVTSVQSSWSNRLPPSLVGGSVSPRKSPTKSPAKAGGGDGISPSKAEELGRRQALEKRLAEEDAKNQQKKKKKKIKF